MRYLHYNAVADTQFATFILGRNFIQSQIHLQKEMATWAEAPRRQNNIVRTAAKRSCGDWKMTFRKNSRTIWVIWSLAVICSTCEIIFDPKCLHSPSRLWALEESKEFWEPALKLNTCLNMAAMAAYGTLQYEKYNKASITFICGHNWPQLATTLLPWAKFRQWRYECAAKHAFTLNNHFALGTPGTSFPTSHWS